ncbi:MAG TPA: kelch repeat-containing protein, partial [Bacteroidia bacterium]|nr:kelch repeat-containing protein [Bacteroidia bacterium]
MKKLIFFLSILFISKSIQAQEWTWMKGTDTLTKPGIYGTMGVASPSNNPGARHGAATWVDNNGDLWLFGGEGVTTNTVLCWLNDLWKYTVSTGNWTWMGGTNLPNQ